MNINETRTLIADSLARVNAGYIARHTANPASRSYKNACELQATGGTQSDVASAIVSFSRFTDAQIVELQKLGVDWSRIVANFSSGNTAVKVAKRLPQFLLFVITGDIAELQGSALLGMVEFCGLGIGAKNKNGLRFAATGKGNEHTSDAIDTSRATKIRKAFGATKNASASTQESVTFSQGGMLDTLGIATAHGRGENAIALIVDCQLSRSILHMIDSATDGVLEGWANQIESRKGNK